MPSWPFYIQIRTSCWVMVLGVVIKWLKVGLRWQEGLRFGIWFGLGVAIGSWLWDWHYLVWLWMNKGGWIRFKMIRQLIKESWRKKWGDVEFPSPLKSLVFLSVWAGVVFVSGFLKPNSFGIGLLAGFSGRLGKSLWAYVKEGVIPPYFYIFLRDKPNEKWVRVGVIGLLIFIGIWLVEMM